MAHHSRTPSSVLNAPKSNPVTISDQSGYSRAERRRAFTYVDKSGPVDEVKVGFGRSFIPKAAQLPATNQPYVKAEVAEQIRGTKSALARLRSLVTFGARRDPKSVQS